MKVGLMADTHDRLPAIKQLIDVLLEKGVSLVMHAGDYCSPFSLEPFNEANVILHQFIWIGAVTGVFPLPFWTLLLGGKLLRRARGASE